METGFLVANTPHVPKKSAARRGGSENIQSDNRFPPITPGSVGNRSSFAALRIG